MNRFKTTRTERMVMAILMTLAVQLSACGSANAQLAPLPDYSPNANDERGQIPDDYKWKLDQLFDSPEAWETKRAELEGRLPELAACQGKMSDELYRCLDLYFTLHNETNHVTLFANLLHDVEHDNQQYQAMTQKGLALMDELMATAGFMRSEILGLEQASLDAAYTANPELEAYRNYIDGLRRRKDRVLDAESERILSLMGDNLWAEIDLNEIPAPVEEAFAGIMADIQWPTIKDAEGKEVQLNLSNYSLYRRSPNREVRKAAVEAMMGTLRQYQHVLTATLAGQAEFNTSLAKARHYDSALQAYLDKDNIDTSVYLNLIDTVNQNLDPLHRYVDLRKKIMGLDEVHLYDLYVPLVESADAEVSYVDARAQIIEALAPMGEDYVAVLTEATDPTRGWIDVYPAKGKGSGAFSASVYGRHPYVKMNFQNTLGDMSTLAHEYGHALHSYLAMSNQSYPDYRYVPFLAEIASTANEALLSDYLIANAEDPKVKAALLVERLESIRSTIYRQTLFAEFELALHTYIDEGTPVTAELLDKTYSELVKKYYGASFTVDADDGMEWAYVPHFYWKYYVFTYATGLSSGIAIAKLVRQGEAEREAYLGMLKAGCSDAPLDILAGAGVDLTKPDAIVAALESFDATITELEALLPELEK